MSTVAASNRTLLAVIAGIGNGAGTGAASARMFAQQGYSIALIGRNQASLDRLTEEIKTSGGNAAGFRVDVYSAETVSQAFTNIRTHFPSASYDLRVGIFNATHLVWKPFLEVTPEDVDKSVELNITAPFAFSREIIVELKKNDLNPEGKRGTLIFTSATASIRGNIMTSAFAAGHAAKRSLSQSLAKEFGKDNIQVSHAIIDGAINTDLQRGRRNDPAWEENPDVRLNPESIASAYLYLVKQDRSAWTWEFDLRPAHEKW